MHFICFLSIFGEPFFFDPPLPYFFILQSFNFFHQHLIRLFLWPPESRLFFYQATSSKMYLGGIYLPGLPSIRRMGLLMVTIILLTCVRPVSALCTITFILEDRKQIPFLLQFFIIIILIFCYCQIPVCVLNGTACSVRYTFFQ